MTTDRKYRTPGISYYEEVLRHVYEQPCDISSVVFAGRNAFVVRTSASSRETFLTDVCGCVLESLTPFSFFSHPPGSWLSCRGWTGCEWGGHLIMTVANVTCLLRCQVITVCYFQPTYILCRVSHDKRRKQRTGRTRR